MQQPTENNSPEQIKARIAYVQRVKAEQKKQDQLQVQLNNATFTEEKLSQVNSKSNKAVHGQAAQYKNNLSSCKFKLICYFKKKKDCSFYSIAEKQNNRHRRQIPSIDIYNAIGGVIRTDHEIAYNTLLNYCLQNTDNLDKAMLIVNDFIKEEEITILIFNPQHVQASQSVTPVFKDFKGGRYFDSLDGNALRVDKMRFYQ